MRVIEIIRQVNKRRREEEGKDTTFSFRGKEVPRHKIDRFAKRRKEDVGISMASKFSDWFNFQVSLAIFVDVPY